jgi:hypothetical protein
VKPQEGGGALPQDGGGALLTVFQVACAEGGGATVQQLARAEPRPQRVEAPRFISTATLKTHTSGSSQRT